MAQNRIGILIETKESGTKAASDTVSKSLNEIEKSSGSASAAATKFKDNFSFIGTAAKVAAATVVASATAFVGFGLASATQLQNTAASFRALTGDATVAKELFTDLYDFARGTPFAFPDVTGAARTLLGYGRTATQVKADIQVLGGMVATTGADWSRLAVVYGQVNAAGKLYAQDALQLIENGVPITTALAKKLGLSITEVRDKMAAGEISAQMFNEAMRAMVPADAIEKMSNTMTGRLSGLTGSVRALAFSLVGIDYSKFDDGSPVLVVQGGLFDRLTKAVQGFSDVMTTPALKQAAKEIGDGLATFVEGAGKALIDWVKWGATHLPEIKFALLAVAGAFVAFKAGNIAGDFVELAKASETLGVALAAMGANPMALVLAATAALVVGFLYLQEKFDIVGKAVGFFGAVWGHLQDAWTASVNFLKGAFDTGMRAAGAVLDFLRDRVRDGINFWNDYDDWIKGIAITLGVLFGPALIRAGVIAVIQGAKIAGSGISAGAGWVKGAVSTSVSWSINSAKAAASSFVASVKMVGHSIAVGVSHSVQAVKSAAVWSFNLAKMALASNGTAIKMALHAADVGWAWAINGARVAFVWVSATLPKIVASMAVTAYKSVVHAAAVSAGWTAAAAKSAYSWVVIELPKIVAASYSTSTKSVAHAVAVSAAWVGSAAKSAFAWVVTTLPRIIFAFGLTVASAVSSAALATAVWVTSAVTSGNAWTITQLPRIIATFMSIAAVSVAQAAVSAGAWIASATSSSAAVVALKLLVATPMVMPAIVVAAAVASLLLVMDAANRAKSAIDGAQAAQDKERDDSISLIRGARAKFDRGEINGGELSRLLKVYSAPIPGNALGSTYTQGGRTRVGEHGPEDVMMPQGAVVTPAYRTRSESQQSGGHTIVIEQFNNNNGGDYHRILKDIGFALELAS